MIISKSLKQSIVIYALAIFALTGLAVTIPLHADTLKEIIHLPLEIRKGRMPHISMEINGTPQDLVLDTGSLEAMHLTKEYMGQIPNLIVSPEKRKSTDLTGKIFYNDKFIIKQLLINGMLFHDLNGVSFQPWGFTLSEDTEAPPEHMVIGLGLFENRSILIDYKNGVLAVADKFADLDVDPAKGWISMPFILTKEGLIAKIKLGSHEHSMILDTGASVSMFFKDRLKLLDRSVSCESLGYTLNIKNCTAVQFQFTDLPAPSNLNAILADEDFTNVPFDGLIGWDFFDQYGVVIDFSEKRIFVKHHESTL